MFQKNIRKQFKNSVFSKTGYKPMMFQQPAHHNNLIIQKKNESLLWDSRYQSPIISAEEKLFEGPTKLAFQFTHLNPEFITRDISEIQELYQGIGTSNWQDPHYRCLQNLVVFKPDRKAMHLLQAYLTLNFSFHTSEEFLMALRHIEPLIVQQVQLKQDSFHLIHKNALSYATNDNDKLKQITQLIHKKLQKSNTAFSSHKIDLIGRKILFDDFYKETLRTELFTIIKKEVSQIFKHKIHSLTPLSHHLCTQRYTQVIIGAPPTGKSWLMKNTLQDFNLHLSDFANISPDKFRLHLLGHPSLGEDRSIHGTLTHGESCVITQESIRHLYEILQENQQAPHVFLEQMNAGRDAIHLGLFRGSKLRISVTHYPIEKAIHGNHERFIRTQKRKVPLQSILNAFKSVSETIPEVLTNNSGQDIVYYLYDIDELIHRKLAKSEVLIARIDCQSQTIIIKNIPGFIQFYKNAFMNINAKGSSELYDSLNLSDTLVIDAILEKFQSITFIFSKPDVHNINAEVLLENEYARYSQAEGMTIKNIDVFEEVKEDIVSQKLFERFELHSFVGHLRAWNK